MGRDNLKERQLSSTCVDQEHSFNSSQALIEIKKNTTEHDKNTEHFIWIVFDFSGILLCHIRGHQDLG